MTGDTFFSIEEPPDYLTTMPEEVLERVFLFIDDKYAHRDILSLERTCRAFRTLLQNDNIWGLFRDKWQDLDYAYGAFGDAWLEMEEKFPPTKREKSFFVLCRKNILRHGRDLGIDFENNDENYLLKYLGGIDGVRRVTSKLADAMKPPSQHAADHPTMPRLQDDAILYLVKVIQNSVILRLRRALDLVVRSLRRGDGYPIVTADDLKRLDNIFLSQRQIFDDCSIPLGSHCCTRCFCNSDTQFWTWPEHNCCDDEFLGELDRCKLVRALAFTAEIVKFSGDVISTISAEILHDMAELVTIAIDECLTNEIAGADHNNDTTMDNDNCRLGERNNNRVITRLHIYRAAYSVGRRNEWGLKYITNMRGTEDEDDNDDLWGPNDDDLDLEVDASHPAAEVCVPGTVSIGPPTSSVALFGNTYSIVDPTNYLITMPEEVLVRILLFIDDKYAHRDILSIERTCLAFRNLLRNDNIWALFQDDDWCIFDDDFAEMVYYFPPTTREMAFFPWCWDNIHDDGYFYDYENLVLKYLGGIDGVRRVTSKLVDAMMHPPQHTADNQLNILPLLQDDAILYLVKIIQSNVILRLTRARDLVYGSLRMGDGFPIVTADDLKRLDCIFLTSYQEGFQSCSIPNGKHKCTRCFCYSETQFWTWPEHNCCDDEFLGVHDRCKLVRALAFTAGILKLSGDVFSTVSTEILHDMAELVTIAFDVVYGAVDDRMMFGLTDDGTNINSDNNEMIMDDDTNKHVITRRHIKRAAEIVGLKNLRSVKYMSDVVFGPDLEPDELIPESDVGSEP